MTPEHVVLLRSIEVVDFAPPGEAGVRIVSDSLKRCDLVGIKNHGFFSLGRDLHEAASRLEVIEESAKIYVTARQFGNVHELGQEDLRRIRRGYSRG